MYICIDNKLNRPLFMVQDEIYGELFSARNRGLNENSHLFLFYTCSLARFLIVSNKDMKNTCYKGCKNAASATAKIVYKFEDGVTATNYFGDTGDAIDALHENKNNEALKPFEYDIFIRNLNFVTGRYGNWVWVEKGNKNYITSYNW